LEEDVAMRVLILNLDPKNKGNEALVFSTKYVINRFRSDVEYIYMGGSEDTRNTKHTIIPLPTTTVLEPRAWLYLLECFIARKLRRCGYGVSLPKGSRVRAYDDVDVVINSGGDYLSGEKFTLSGFFNIIYALWLGKPVVLFAESLGFYKSSLNRIVSRYVFENVNLILVREDLSKEYLLNMGINPDKVHVTADPAFLLPSAPRSRVDEILRSENILIASGPVIGMNPSGSISRYLDPAKPHGHYVQLMTDAIDYIVETQGATILLIPHVYSPGSDDRDIIGKIIENVSNPQRVFQIKNEYTAAELKGIIGLCDVFVGARMHATIAATSLCIPTVGVAYSHKMYGIIGSSLDMNQYIISIDQLDATQLIKTLDMVWSNRTAIKEHLEETMPKIKEKALLNGHYFSDLLKNLESNCYTG
jgi:colanic acid/amylovoran biosynthesis protein